jgi:hypothetical protein
MKTRRIILEEDYDTIASWWTARGGTAPPVGILPMTGVMVEQDGNPVSCAFLYEDKGGRVAMIEWEATNPEVHSAMAQVRSLHCIFDFFEKYCRDQGIQLVLSWVAEGRGDGRVLLARNWTKCPGQRHELMAFNTLTKEALCP